MPSLIEVARDLYNKALDALGTPKEKELLEKAADAYEKAGKDSYGKFAALNFGEL